jgi:hypothetical protein
MVRNYRSQITLKGYFLRLIIFLIVILISVSCQPSDYVDYINILGVAVDDNGAPVENVTVVTFFDGVEISRFVTLPMYASSYSGCSKAFPSSALIDNDCYNFSFEIPRVAEFVREQTAFTANVRLLKISQQITFRSIDGRFLVIKALSTPPPRNILLLMQDDSVVTPAPGTAVYTPTFSARPSPTPIAATDAQLNAQSDSSSDFFNDWIRPFILGSLITIVPSILSFYAIRSQKPSGQRPVNKQSIAESKKKSDTTSSDAIIVGIMVQAVGSVLATIFIKLVGWA